MRKPLLPKPKIRPLVRRTLMVATLGVAGCSSADRVPMRIGPPPQPQEAPWIRPQVQLRGADGAPLANAQVRVILISASGPQDEWLLTTDAQGALHLDNMPADDYEFELVVEGYAPQRVQYGYGAGAYREVTLQPAASAVDAGVADAGASIAE